LHIRTGAFEDGTVWAAIIDRKVGMEELRSLFHLGDLQREAEARPTLRGHDVERWLRAEGTRAITRCVRCGARLYVDRGLTPAVMSGEVFDEDCH
jgi:hypothetical protein